jgi:hypothetical protein
MPKLARAVACEGGRADICVLTVGKLPGHIFRA